MTQAFQIEVTSRTREGRQVFAVEAASQMRAEWALMKDRRTMPDPVFNLRRMMSQADITKLGLASGHIVQLL